MPATVLEAKNEYSINANTLAKLITQLKVSPTDQGPQSGLTIQNNIRRLRRPFTKAKAKAQSLREVHLQGARLLLGGNAKYA